MVAPLDTLGFHCFLIYLKDDKLFFPRKQKSSRITSTIDHERDYESAP